METSTMIEEKIAAHGIRRVLGKRQDGLWVVKLEDDAGDVSEGSGTELLEAIASALVAAGKAG